MSSQNCSPNIVCPTLCCPMMPLSVLKSSYFVSTKTQSLWFAGTLRNIGSNKACAADNTNA